MTAVLNEISDFVQNLLNISFLWNCELIASSGSLRLSQNQKLKIFMTAVLSEIKVFF